MPPPPPLPTRSQYESLDFEETWSAVDVSYRHRDSVQKLDRREILRWAVMFAIGFTTAVIAFSIDMVIKVLSWLKLSFIASHLEQCRVEGCLGYTFLTWAAFNVGLVFIASCFVIFFAAVSQGSGIPEVKCYLNGVKVPEVVRLKTVLCKTMGVTFSVAGGLCVGKEGPMIHSGAVVAAGLSQGKSTSVPRLGLGGLADMFFDFRNDAEKRDFVSAGAAAGVSAAFGAPVGGLLFSLEEGSSFWNQARAPPLGPPRSERSRAIRAENHVALLLRLDGVHIHAEPAAVADAGLDGAAGAHGSHQPRPAVLWALR